MTYCRKSNETANSLEVNDFFDSIYNVQITNGTEMLSRDFCLFTEDEQHVIIASAVPNVSSILSSNFQATKNPYSVNALGSLDDIAFYLVELKSGIVKDKICFEADYIYLSNHTGVSICGSRLAITSVRHQIIHIYFIDNAKGRFAKVGTVGYSLYEDDELVWTRAGHGRPSSEVIVDPIYKPLLGFRHRFMAYLYRNALSKENPTKASSLLFMNWNYYAGLCIWKAQFLDRDHLLLKIGAEEQLSGRNPESIPNVVFFVIYKISTTEIICLYRGNSSELYKLLTSNHECFRTMPAADHFDLTSSCWHPNYTPTPSTIDIERYLWDRQFELYSNSKNAGDSVAIKRILSGLPYSSQCGFGGSLESPISPYLDTSLFRYDDKTVGPGDRPKPSSDFPVKFFHRDSDLVAFRLIAGPSYESLVNSASGRIKYYCRILCISHVFLENSQTGYSILIFPSLFLHNTP